MQVKPDQLDAHLQKTLASVYVVSGDEFLLVSESVAAIRQAAQAQGFSERQVYSVERGFDWNQLLQNAGNLSLFGDRQIMELRLSTLKIGDQGAQALRDYMDAVADGQQQDTLLIISTPKLDPAVQKTKWFKAVAAAAVLLTHWPVSAEQLPGWLARRARALGIELSPQALNWLADRVEGNLLAAAQELEKLRLVAGQGRVEDKLVAESIGDSARFNVYTLIDHCLAGHANKAVQMLQGLRAEGFEKVILLWALAREIRLLASLAEKMAEGHNVEMLMQQQRVWERRKPLIRTALRRHPAQSYLAMLEKCYYLDCVIKGQAVGQAWDVFLQLICDLAGKPLFVKPGQHSLPA